MSGQSGDIKELILRFNGYFRLKRLFLRQCDYVISICENYSEKDRLEIVTSRLTGRAAYVIRQHRKQITTYEDFKKIINKYFSDYRSEKCIEYELKMITRRPNERHIIFFRRIQSLRDQLCAKMFDNTDDKNLREVKMAIYNRTALEVFIYNLPLDMAKTVWLYRPDTLEKALEIVLEEESFKKYRLNRRAY